jgi:hypothetical protein
MKEQQIKEKIKGAYGKIALVGYSSERCCASADLLWRRWWGFYRKCRTWKSTEEEKLEV